MRDENAALKHRLQLAEHIQTETPTSPDTLTFAPNTGPAVLAPGPAGTITTVGAPSTSVLPPRIPAEDDKDELIVVATHDNITWIDVVMPDALREKYNLTRAQALRYTLVYRLQDQKQRVGRYFDGEERSDEEVPKTYKLSENHYEIGWKSKDKKPARILVYWIPQ